MTRRVSWGIGVAAAFLLSFAARAEVKTTIDYNDAEHAKPQFSFPHVPSPSATDAGYRAKFSIVDGERDPAGAPLEVLNDGLLPTESDQPVNNFFFAPDTDGGRIAIDMGKETEIRQVNTYSWHAGPRAPQVYKLYAATGSATDFNAAPKKETDPAKVGWTLLASVDTRTKHELSAGQYGVSTANADAGKPLGAYRYLLLDVSRTESDDQFGNTFYSEVDVIAAGDKAANKDELLHNPADAPKLVTMLVTAGPHDEYHITIDTTQTPDLTDWAQKELAPVVRDWYPQLVDMLPSDNYQAPRTFKIVFDKAFSGGLRGAPAYTGGVDVHCQHDWFSKNLKGEARGAVVHELVHVVQQYGQARRRNPNAHRGPGWLTEGIPDYIRWFLYEPQTHGADIRPNRVANAKYDASYRVTANFLNYVVHKYDKQLIEQLNDAMRNGKYSEDLWKQYTGKTVQELADEWKVSLGAPPSTKPATKPVK
jgi:hypothetical protein